MLTVALWLNIAVFSVIIGLMLAGGKSITRILGTLTPARSNLLAVYLAFLATSILFALWPLEPGIITLLAIQISYLVLSAFTVRVLTNPLVIGNLLLACFHVAALVIHSMPA